uniref:Uncharacterized protein n=1 Tax=Kwoniella pini CBS 10737 TaxID=1296096 RepID=A0A1B9HWD2_9TREE|nr:uncharacterized protein I206_06486 [Kwoniella pini CBS 10737]OCF47583.1 hypothetical protein I206_06486 [Kwoniella pini CBS 10737]
MPFFQSFQDFKGLTSSINPLNLFSSEQPSSSSPSSSNPTPIATPQSASAEAGPGPSTQAMRQPSTPFSGPTSLGRPIDNRQVYSGPIRPSLKPSPTSSSPNSSDSSDSNERRRVSRTNVMIADPEVSGIQGQRERKRSPRKGSNSRPPSSITGSTGISGVEAEQRLRKKKSPMETYIIVKPPPTSAKNPLNLQIQLVVRPNRPRRDRSVSAQTVDLPTEESDDTSAKEIMNSPDTVQSTKSQPNDKGLTGSPKSSSIHSEGANGAGVRRSSSIRSSISTSTAATGSSAASGKRIEPMFNLAVHNVMQPTVVTDAATDVKVAKFHKRNLDITGVGVLEPSEVWLPTHQPTGLFAPPTRQTTDGEVAPRQRPLSLVSLTSPISPTLSRSDDGKSGIRGSLDLKSFKMENLRIGQKADGESRTRQFFGKVFKKKTSLGEIGLAPKKTSPSASFSSFDYPPRSATSTTHDFAGVDTLHPNMAAAIRNQPSNTTDLPSSIGVGAPTFGTAPLVVSRRSSGALITPDGAVTGLTSHVNLDLENTATRMERCQSLPIIPSNRPVGYTWTVRKWAKKNEEGWAAHLKAAANAGLEIVGGNAGSEEEEDEVVFEWVKLRVPSNSTGDEILRRYSTTGAISQSKARARSQTRASSVPPHISQGAEGININSPNTSRTSLNLQPPKAKREASPFPPSSPNLNSSNQNSPFSSPRLDGRPEPIRRISGPIVIGSGSGSGNNSRRSSTIIDIEETNSILRGGGVEGGGGGETEEDSDPEDSETPWTCSIWIKKTGQRQLLGTLTPAPHHPKVIGILKIPQGLNSICLTDFKQSSTNSNSGLSLKEGTIIKKLKENISLTEENLKDVVCVTSLWLVAREEFNGLGKKKSSTGLVGGVGVGGGGGRRGTYQG